MDREILLDNFIYTILDTSEDVVEYNGEKVNLPSLEQSELSFQFTQSLNTKTSPEKFKDNLENILKDIKFNLEKRYKMYLYIIYKICYLRENKINLLNTDDFSSKNIQNLMFENEDKIKKFYEKILSLNLN